MRLRRLAAAAMALMIAAGPAAAQGTFNPGGKPGSWKPTTPASKPRPHETPYAPPAKPAPAARPKPVDPDQPPGFKPYEPWKPKSVFGPDGKPKS